MEKTLKEEIEHAINRHSGENFSNTPDYILAEYLMECLRAFGNATNKRSSWYSLHPNFIECSNS